MDHDHDGLESEWNHSRSSGRTGGEDNDNEWELSKENVLPLRQGRQMASLAAALHSVPNEQVFKENQRAFEEELRAYTGDDPLDVWDRYIKWTEQYFPKGGREGHLSKLIERCLQKFTADSTYTNDVRFMRLWIKFAGLSERPTEVYAYMFDKGIGLKVAAFYVEWAISLEMVGNTKQADTIYTEGLNRLAEPRDLLLEKRKEFEYRLARNIILQKGDFEESEMEVGETEEDRSALCRLKGSGIRHKVGTTRTGVVKQGSAGFFKNANAKTAQQVPSKGISIFVDKENDSSSVRPQVTHEWKSMPKKTVDNRENDKKPGIWTDARMHQRPRHVEASEPAYQIHEDATATQETPQKTAFINKQPLSSRKADRQTADVLSSIKEMRNVVQPGEGIPCYEKNKVYNGVQEFSLEELRAIRYWKLRKQRELDAERQHELEVRSRREAQMAAIIKEQGQRLAMMESRLDMLNIQSAPNGIQQASLPACHQEQPRKNQEAIFSEQSQPSSQIVPPQMNSSQGLSSSVLAPSSSQPSSQKQVLEASASSDVITPNNQSGFLHKHGSLTSSVSSSGGSHRTPIFNSSLSLSHGKTPGSTNSSLLRLSKSKHTVASAPAPALNESSASLHNNSSLYAESARHSFATSTTPGSQESSILQKPHLSAPSPTVCTKEALQLVQGMFCTDLEQDNLAESLHEYEQPMAFKICEDVVPVEQKSDIFKIHCDDQSAVPTTAIKEKPKSFGLRKSFVPMDEGTCDFTIECQARDDMTIAPLDNFSMQARAASTPFSSSRIKLEQTQELHSEVSLNSCSTSADGYDRGGATSMNNLSPIIENSEGSNEESHSTKSHSQMSELGMSTRVKTILPPGCSIKEEEVEEAQGDVSMHDDQPLDATHHHLIDTSACIAMFDEKTQDLLSASAYIAPRNPFDEKFNAEFLSHLNPPLSKYPNYHVISTNLPELSILAVIELDQSSCEFITIEKLLGEGGYAKVFLVSLTSLLEDDSEFLAMKVQRPPCHWEFYIACEMQKRLAAFNAPMDVTPAISKMKSGHFHKDCSLLMTEFMPHGSLLNLINLYKGDRQLFGNVEPFACLLTIELLHLIEQLHKCNFIHGDVKPDNFLFRDLPTLPESQNRAEVFGSQLRLICLTDFGQSIDLTMFPPGTTFKAKVVTSAFQCIEMRTDRLWTFQTDLFGMAGTIHVALFGSYMKVFMERGTWKTTSNFARKWNVPLWKKLFQELLNIPSCDLMPNLSALRAEFEDYMLSSLIKPYNSWVMTVSSRLSQQTALENTIT